MKNLLKFTGLLGALALGTTFASAAPGGDPMHVDIPFSFVVAGKVFPAGQYTVQETDSGIILVRGQGAAAMALSLPGNALKSGSLPAVQFTSNNGREYLAAVQDQISARTVPLHPIETRTLTLSH